MRYLTIMKKIGLLSFLPLLLLCSCKSNSNSNTSNSSYSSPIYQNYLNKEYELRGFICRFYEDKMSYFDDYSRYPCFYEKSKFQKNVAKNDDYPDVTIESNKEYVFVFVQGIDKDHSAMYKFLGVFSNDNTFVTISTSNYQLSVKDVFTAK